MRRSEEDMMGMIYHISIRASFNVALEFECAGDVEERWIRLTNRDRG